jgi:hypothetical protein
MELARWLPEGSRLTEASWDGRTSIMRCVLAAAVVCIFLCLSSCNRRESPRMTAATVSQQAVCANCGRMLLDVQDNNRFTVDGIELVVCDHQCAAGVIRRVVGIEQEARVLMLTR